MGVLPAFNSRSHVNVITGNSTSYLDNIAIALPLGIGLCSLSLLTFLGNAMVVHAIRTERKLHTVSNMFILSLAIADLTVGLIVMPISSVYVLLGDWILGLLVCQLWLVIDYTASTASIFNLLILSLDRYWSIRSPLKYLCKRTKKRALGMIGIVWLISVLWVIPIIGWHLWYNNGIRKHPSNVCETEFNDAVFFKLTTSAANFFIPMILMVVIYYKIFCEIKRRGKIDIGRSLSVSCANHTKNLSKSSQRKQRKLFERNYLRTSCASCSSWSGKRVTKIVNNKEQQIETDCDQDLMQASSLIEREKDKKEKNSCSDAESDKNKCLQSEDEDKVGKELSSSVTSNSLSGEQVKHYQQLTLMSLKPEKPIYALEDYQGVKVEVEYINGGSTLNVISSSSSANKPISPPINESINILSPNQSNSKCDNSVNKNRTKKSNKKKCLKKSLNNSSDDKNFKWSLTKPNKSSKHTEGNCESLSSRPSIALPANEFCSECQCTAVAAAAVTHHQNALRREESSRLRQEKKAARQLGVILGAFILCWMPYIITFIVTAYCTDCVSSTVHQVAIWLGYVNSFLNPFLYALCNENFKQAFKKLLGRVKPQQPSYNFDLTHGTSFRCQKNYFS